MSITIESAIKTVEKAVETVINDKPQDFPIAANIGDAVRQGDIYIQLIEPVSGVIPFYKKLVNPDFPIQLAPGNTKGSRHMLENSEGIEVYECVIASLIEDAGEDFDFELSDQVNKELEIYARYVTSEDEKTANNWSSQSRKVAQNVSEAMNFFGPIFTLKNPGCVSHPEHGNWNLPAGTYRIVFQRTLDANQRARRVFD
jgi:hypothetical protein